MFVVVLVRAVAVGGLIFSFRGMCLPHQALRVWPAARPGIMAITCPWTSRLGFSFDLGAARVGCPCCAGPRINVTSDAVRSPSGAT